MSTKGARDYRPTLHYTPPKAWINDPNGLVWDGERYHLFAQHYPDDTKHGPMHWIHATSEDLIHWTHHGIALAPDELGFIFSGSAIVDRGNTSGLGDGRDPIIAMFTHHGAKDHLEQQSIAYSNDGINFIKYQGNPVIENPGIKDFRDPKVFRNEQLNCWSCVIASGDCVSFYRSDNFIQWTKTGEFGKTENKMGGIFECPDLFPLTAPDGSILFALTASMIQPQETGGSRTQYFLGAFDGYTFHETIPFAAPELIDYGYDNYAAVTFAGAKDTLLLGWGTSWTYAAQEPTGEYCGCMTLARKQSLVQTDEGIRLASEPVLPKLNPAEVIQNGGKLPGEVFVLDIQAQGPFAACLQNARGERFCFGLGDDGAFYTDRSQSGEMGFSELYNSPIYQFTNRRRLKSGPVRMRAVFDRSMIELYADDGTYVNTTLMFPTAPYETIALDGATATIATVKE